MFQHPWNSWSYHKQDVQANLLIYVLFTAISLIKKLVAKIHKMYTINKIEIVKNLQCFDNSLILNCLSSCQLLVSVFLCYTIMSGHFICCFGVVYVGSAYKHQVLLHMVYLMFVCTTHINNSKTTNEVTTHYCIT